MLIIVLTVQVVNISMFTLGTPANQTDTGVANFNYYLHSLSENLSMQCFLKARFGSH